MFSGGSKGNIGKERVKDDNKTVEIDSESAEVWNIFFSII